MKMQQWKQQLQVTLKIKLNCPLKRLFTQGKQESIDAYVLGAVFAFKNFGTFSGKSFMEIIMESYFDKNGF